MPPVGGWNTGVYAITHRVSGKSYIGGAYKSFGLRFWIHRRDLRAGRHGNQHLQNAWNKYGASSFSFRILERCSPESCEEREQYWIDILDATDRRYGYNKSPTAGSPLGTKHPPEYGKVISERNRARSKDPLHREKMLKAITIARDNVTQESYRKIGDALRGRKRPQEVVEKISAALKGKKRSGEALARITLANRSRVNTPELREKLGRANRGRKWSAEVIAKRSAGLKLAWKLRKEQNCEDGKTKTNSV